MVYSYDYNLYLANTSASEIQGNLECRIDEGSVPAPANWNCGYYSADSEGSSHKDGP